MIDLKEIYCRLFTYFHNPINIYSFKVQAAVINGYIAENLEELKNIIGIACPAWTEPCLVLICDLPRISTKYSFRFPWEKFTIVNHNHFFVDDNNKLDWQVSIGDSLQFKYMEDRVIIENINITGISFNFKEYL